MSGHRETGYTSNEGLTGDSFEAGIHTFFGLSGTASGSGSDVDIDEGGLRTFESGVVSDDQSEKIDEMAEQQMEFQNDVKAEMAGIRKELAMLRRLLISQGGRLRYEEARQIVDGDEGFDEWLHQWMTEEPDAFMTEKEVKAQIAEYEEEYGMSSDEMMHRLADGTVPDDFEIMDWQVLLESLK